MNYNPSPKSEFQRDKDRAAKHKQMAADPYLRDALNVSLLEYQRQVTSARSLDMGAAAAGLLRIMGANELIDTFLNLAETPSVVPMPDVVNLPGNKPTKTN